jgi:type IV pilus assembly protein PilW
MTSACDAAVVSPIRQFHTHIYFVSPCSLPSGSTGNCAANPTAPRVPTLERMELGVNGFKIAPLVEGVENVQLEYGLDNDNDGNPDIYTVTPANTGTAWASVVAIRIHLLSRNNEATPGFTDSKTYRMGTIVTNNVTPNDGYKRHEYVGLVRVLNMSQRKEIPL